MPAAYFGEIPCAYIELENEMHVTAEEVINCCRQELAPYKVIKKVVFIDKLLRNAVGKLIKRELRKLQEQ